MEPTFVIAGGQRCGTTTLYTLCDEHPEIYMAKPAWPEPKFFVGNPEGEKDRQWYLDRWFSDTGSARAVGEKSTSYLEIPGAAERIKALFPGMKVVFILRHPVERAVSNYRFSRRNGLEKLSLGEAIDLEPSRLRDESFAGLSVHPFAYLRRGRYIEHLEQFFEYFPEEDLKIVLNDDLNEHGEQMCRDLYLFLDVSPSFVPPALGLRHNTTPMDELQVPQWKLDEMFDAFVESNRLLEQRLGRDLSMWSEMTPMLRRLVESDVDKS